MVVQGLALTWIDGDFKHADGLVFHKNAMVLRRGNHRIQVRRPFLTTELCHFRSDAAVPTIQLL
jgi:hypothetical protein